jgi:hypothetical protein
MKQSATSLGMALQTIGVQPTTASSPPWLVTRLIARNHDGQGYPAGSFLNHAQALGIG